MAPVLTATRLNLGCGDVRHEGYINIDLRPEVADVVTDVRNLSAWADESVDEIRADDIIEHFPRSATPQMLAEWRRVLRPGGLLRLHLPNMLALAEALVLHAKGGNSGQVNLLILNIYGGHRWGVDGDLDCHHNGWTPDTLARELGIAGFRVTGNDEALNMTVTAVKV